MLTETGSFSEMLANFSNFAKNAMTLAFCPTANGNNTTNHCRIGVGQVCGMRKLFVVGTIGVGVSVVVVVGSTAVAAKTVKEIVF